MRATTRKPPILSVKDEAQPARLLPAFKQREPRAVSSVLAALQVVPDFARDLLAEVGHSVGKKSKPKIECFTEVTLKSGGKQLRPDGLIAVTNRGKTWHAFVEAKVENEDLEKDQIEQYLRLARENGVDAVITLSNQFCIHPQYHPVSIDKNLLRSKKQKLYHLSWTWLLTIARMCKISDPGKTEKTYILNEIICFLESDYSGVKGFTSMPASEWKQLCTDVRNRVTLRESGESVKAVAEAWRELMRALSLHMSSKLDVPVETREEKKETYEEVRNRDCETLCRDGILQASFYIPHKTGRNITGPIDIAADILGRTIICSMRRIKAPQDKTRASAAFTWLLGQLNKCEDKNITVVAEWSKNV